MTAPRTEPARQTSLRAHNLALVLGEVADRGPASRAGIAAATGLTKASVSSLVDTLVAGGLLDELGARPLGSVGRPGSWLGLSPGGPVGIGLELNVDYLATCTVDLSGAVVDGDEVGYDLRARDVEEVLDRASAAVRRAVDRAPAAVAGVGVAVPGLVDGAGGLLRLAPNLGWRDVPVPDALRARAGLGELPLRLDNEANLAALAELWCGGQHRPDGGRLTTFVHVSGEIGVGAGIVIDGRLFRGGRGFSGEIGHLPVRADGPECRCGAVGCLEQAAGLEAIVRAAGLQPGSGPAPDPPLARVLAAARAGRPETLVALGAAGSWLGVAVASVLNLLDVEAVVLGGIYAALAPWLRGPLEAELANRVLSAGWDPPQVYVSPLGGRAAVRGAATAVVREVIAAPGAYLASGPRPGP